MAWKDSFHHGFAIPAADPSEFPRNFVSATTSGSARIRKIPVLPHYFCWNAVVHSIEDMAQDPPRRLLLSPDQINTALYLALEEICAQTFTAQTVAWRWPAF